MAFVGLCGSHRIRLQPSGNATTAPVAAERSAASTISTAARPSRPVTTGSRPFADRAREVLDLRGEALEPVRVEVVAQEIERHLLMGESRLLIPDGVDPSA